MKWHFSAEYFSIEFAELSLLYEFDERRELLVANDIGKFMNILVIIWRKMEEKNAKYTIYYKL